MDAGWTQELLAWLNANPGWAFAIVLAVSIVESLVLVGILLPGILILFGVGALIGLGAIEMTPVWVAASAGAFIGDTISYLIGHRLREHLLDVWPFTRYPGLMERGTRFFHVHGTKSVVAGRFIGPLRPIIPAVGGMMGMPVPRFLVVDIIACVLWAPAYLLPGMLFGASLEVASQYTTRLAVMLVILVVTLWLTWWLIRAVYEPLASRSARWLRHAIRWTRRHPVLGRVADPLLGPARGEALSVTMLGFLLVLVFWGFVMLLFLGPFSAQPQALDRAVADLALSLRNHLADPVMVAISELSRWPVPLLTALALLLWLVGARRYDAALHWLIAIGGGGLLHLLLSWTLRATPQVLELGDELIRRPSAEMGLTTVVLTFFAVMEAGELRRKHRQWPYMIAALIVSLLALARIYLGMEWLSGALMGVAMGMAWAAIVGIAYRQRAVRRFSGSAASLIFFGAYIATFAWQLNEHLEQDLRALATPTVQREVDLEAWWREEWRKMPAERTQLAGASARRFNAQVAVRPEKIAALLQQDGWEQVPESDWRWFLQALNPKPDEASLPLLGRAWQGRSEALLLRHHIDGEGRLLTLRMWDSGVRLLPGGQPLYMAQLTEEELVQRYGLFSYWRATPMRRPLLRRVREALQGLEQKEVDDGLLLIRNGAKGDPPSPAGDGRSGKTSLFSTPPGSGAAVR